MKMIYLEFIVSFFLHPLRDNPNRVGDYRKYLHEVKTGGIDLINGLKTYDIEKVKDLKNLDKNVFEITEDKTLTQVFVPKNIIKVINRNNDADSQKGSLQNNQQDILEDD